MTDSPILQREIEELEALLDQLGQDSPEIRRIAVDALRHAFDVTRAKLDGEDTTLSETGLRAVRHNLVSASSSLIANLIISHLQNAIQRIAQVAITALTGVPI